MPVIPTVPETVEVRHVVGLPNSEVALNIYNVKVAAATALDSTLANALASAVFGAWSANLDAVMATTVTSLRAVVTDLRVVNGPQFTAIDGNAGSDATSVLPCQVAACIAWKTNTRGRSFRGRTMLGGFTEGGSLGQNPTAGVLTAINGFATTLLANLTTLGHPLVVVSRYEHNPTPPPVTIPRAVNVATEVTSFVVDQAWKTQRTRALKG